MIRLAIPDISARDRRTLLIGTSVVLMLLLVFRAFPAWRIWTHDARTSAAQLSARLATARHNAANVHRITHTVDSLDNVYLSLAPALLSGDSPAQAAATLAAHVSDVATAAGVRLGTVQLTVDSATADADIYHVHIRADGTGDIRGLTTMLQSIESGGAPLLSVRTISISQADPSAPANLPESLRATFEIEGIARRNTEL